jgi:uncharacterized DUF497 family protein
MARFQYDPVKAASNYRKHNVSFADAEGVFGDPLAITILDPGATLEQRFVTIGLGDGGVLLVVVWSERDDECRLISARRATRREQRQYEK